MCIGTYVNYRTSCQHSGGGNGTAVYDMPLPSDVKASTSEPISRYVVCCRHEGVVKGYLFFYRKVGRAVLVYRRGVDRFWLECGR